MAECDLAATAAVSAMVVATGDTEDMLTRRIASVSPMAKRGVAIGGATPVETPTVAMGGVGHGVPLEVVMGEAGRGAAQAEAASVAVSTMAEAREETGGAAVEPLVTALVGVGRGAAQAISTMVA